MEVIKTDILIAGAGPSGLMLACLLTRQNIDFIIIDKATDKIKNSGALVIHAASMEIFRSLGLIAEILTQATIVREVKIQINRGKKHRFDISGIDKGNGSYPSLILLEQFKLESILCKYLYTAGKKILTGNSLISITADSGYNTSTIIDNAGYEFAVRSKYVIGADGKDSLLRELLKIPYTIHRHKNPICIIDYEGETINSPGEILFSFNSGGSFGMFPLQSGYTRLDVALPGFFRKDERIKFEDIENFLPANILIKKIRWFSVFYSNYLLCDTFRSGNIFLIGDAAHTHSPVGGQGLNSGFQDALNLGWKLSYVIKGLVNENILDTYTSERRPIVKKIMSRSDKVFRYVTNFSMIKTCIRLKISVLILSVATILFSFSKIKTRFFMGISQLWIRYRGRLTIESAGYMNKAAGTLFRQHNQVTGCTFYTNYKLLNFTKRDITQNHPELEPLPLDIVNLAELPHNQRLTDRMYTRNKSLILLRPDNFIAMVSDKLEIKKLENYFKDLSK